MNPKRASDLVAKMWRSGLDLIRHPSQAIWLSYHIGARGVHAGELLRLRPLVNWLREQQIDTVLDAGAHQGEFSSAIRALLPAARIYAFEPQPDCAATIASRVGGEIRVFPCALGREEQRATFFRSAFSKSSSLLPMAEQHQAAFPWTSDTETTEVEVRRLDDMAVELDLTGRVLLKIDVQGSELDLLEGARDTLDRVRVLLVELSLETMYQGEPSFDDVYSFLRDRGFSYIGSAQQLSDPKRGNPLQQDALFLRDPV